MKPQSTPREQDASWFIPGDGNQPAGPFTAEEIIESCRAGRVDPNTICWREGMPQWLPIGQVEPFATTLRKATQRSSSRGASHPAGPPPNPETMPPAPHVVLGSYFPAIAGCTAIGFVFLMVLVGVVLMRGKEASNAPSKDDGAPMSTEESPLGGIVREFTERLDGDDGAELRKSSRVYPPSIDASSAGREAMKQYDLNGDGEVSGSELDRAPSLKFALSRLDTDGDGAVSASEVTARVRAWQKSRVGRMAIILTILANGRSLEGATVTLHPEKFLGRNMRPATGITDSAGLVKPSIEIGPGDPPGVAPGLYLVRVTKDGMDISSMYNTQTVLGVEFALDVVELEEDIVFDLR